MKLQEIHKLYHIGNEATKSYLAERYPDILKEKLFRLGSILKRKSYPNAVYALYKSRGLVKLLNVTNNMYWDKNRFFPVRDLNDPMGEYISFIEFKQLTKNAGVPENDFYEVKV